MSTPESEAVTLIPQGIYEIAVASHHFNNQRLTSEDDHGVTILPAINSEHPDVKQKWQVGPGRKPGTITIARPGKIRHALSLTFEGEPRPSARIVLHREEFSTEWILVPSPAHGKHTYIIRVPHNGNFGIAVSPAKIFPPFLDLDDKVQDQLEWHFIHTGVSSEEA